MYGGLHKLGGRIRLQFSHIDCSQHGRRNALTASLLHAAHRSLMGISSIVSDLVVDVSQ